MMETNRSPKISVVMPAYNCASFITKAITSILEQSHSNLELLVCDDASDDDTWKIISSMSDPRIKKYQHVTNKGYLQTYNYLLSLADGDYITFQDADDWSERTRLEEQLVPFNMYPDIHLTACNGGFYYSQEKQTYCPHFKSGPITLKDGNYEFMLPSVLFKREILNSVRGLHQYFDRLTGGDQYFILEILSQFKGFAINRYLYFAHFNPRSNHRTLNYIRKTTIPEAYYLLKRQRITTGTDWLKDGKDDLVLAYEQSLLKNRKFMGEKLREYAVYRVDSKQLNAAWTLLWKAFLSDPLNVKVYRTLIYALKVGLAKS